MPDEIPNKLPEKVMAILQTYPMETHPKIIEFIQSLNELEIQALLIAFDHLGSSFDILRCNGYISK
jgi:hypothetical protein